MYGVNGYFVSFFSAVRSVVHVLFQVTMDDFTKAKEKALYRKKGNVPEGLYL